MPRVATCKDCGARFKVPDSTTATRAKCKTCGGVLEIPPAGAASGSDATATKAPGKAPAKGKAAPARKTKAAPKRAAPQSAKKAAPARKAAASKGSGVKAAPRKAASGKAASGRTAGSGRSGGARSGARKASGGRSGANRGSGGSDSKTGMMIGIGVVVIAVAAVGWWFFGRDDGATPATPDTGSTAAADKGAGDAAGTPAVPQGDKAPAPNAAADGAGDKAPTPGADSTPPAAGASVAGNTPSTPAADTSGDSSKPGKAKAPAPAPVAAAVDPDAPEEPLPTLIEFDVLEPALGSTAEELAEWTAMLKELYIEFGGATGRTRKRLSGQARDLDPALSVPAYLNALNGVDIGEETFVVAVFKMVDDWQKKVAYKPTFSFPADVTRMDTHTQNLRVKVLNGWRDWWVDVRLAGQDQAKLDEYSQAVEEALRDSAGK